MKIVDLIKLDLKLIVDLSLNFYLIFLAEPSVSYTIKAFDKVLDKSSNIF